MAQASEVDEDLSVSLYAYVIAVVNLWLWSNICRPVDAVECAHCVLDVDDHDTTNCHTVTASALGQAWTRALTWNLDPFLARQEGILPAQSTAWADASSPPPKFPIPG
jgi:hypothetical protein